MRSKIDGKGKLSGLCFLSRGVRLAWPHPAGKKKVRGRANHSHKWKHWFSKRGSAWRMTRGCPNPDGRADSVPELKLLPRHDRSLTWREQEQGGASASDMDKQLS